MEESPPAHLMDYARLARETRDAIRSHSFRPTERAILEYIVRYSYDVGWMDAEIPKQVHFARALKVGTDSVCEALGALTEVRSGRTGQKRTVLEVRKETNSRGKITTFYRIAQPFLHWPRELGVDGIQAAQVEEYLQGLANERQKRFKTAESLTDELTLEQYKPGQNDPVRSAHPDQHHAPGASSTGHGVQDLVEMMRQGVEEATRNPGATAEGLSSMLGSQIRNSELSGGGNKIGLRPIFPPPASVDDSEKLGLDQQNSAETIQDGGKNWVEPNNSPKGEEGGKPKNWVETNFSGKSWVEPNFSPSRARAVPICSVPTCTVPSVPKSPPVPYPPVPAAASSKNGQVGEEQVEKRRSVGEQVRKRPLSKAELDLLDLVRIFVDSKTLPGHDWKAYRRFWVKRVYQGFSGELETALGEARSIAAEQGIRRSAGCLLRRCFNTLVELHSTRVDK